VKDNYRYHCQMKDEQGGACDLVQLSFRGNGQLKVVMEGRMLGKRGPGRRRTGMLDQLFKKNTYGAMIRRNEDRSA